MSNAEENLGSRGKAWLGSLSLKRKLTLLFAGLSLVIVSLSMVISFLIELRFFRDRLLDEYRITARMIASNLEAAVLFNDAQGAEEIIEALSQRKSVLVATVYASNGELLATYKGSESSVEALGSLPQPDAVSLLEGDSLVVNEPIMVDKRKRGSLVIVADLREVSDFVIARSWVIIALAALLLVVATALALWLSRLVSEPILDLTRTARSISIHKDFSIRHKRKTNDETGRLVDAFNEMMSQIEARNEVIRSNEARFRGYFRLGVVGMSILDSNLKWLEANDRMLEMVGYSKEDLAGMSWFDLLKDESLQEMKQSFVSGDSSDLAGEYWLNSKGSGEIYAMASLRRVRGTGQIPEHFVLIVQDITDRKRHEEELREARDRAEASNKAKDEFLSVISHELRTPLNPIIGYVEILLGDDPDKEAQQSLQLVKQSAEHLLDLIDNVLDYSRIERGVVRLEDNEFDYRSLCDEVVNIMVGQANEKGLELKHERLASEPEDGEMPTLVRSDRLKLRQIMLNLVSNAVKFTAEGKISIKSSLRLSGEMHILRIEVKDTGIGIKSKDRKKVFQLFSQIDSSLTREYGGIGLGLAFSRKIVHAMNGEIDFKSKQGKGSAFWFEVPVLTAAPSLDSEASQKKPQRAIAKSKRPVLVVEDEPVNRELAKALLKRSGQSVVCAKNGAEALKLAKEQDFSLIIMDIQMPGMNGLDVTRKIREMEAEAKSGHTPIVAATAHVTDSNYEDCMNAGMDDFLSKPFDIERLNDTLERWLKSS